MKFTPKTEKEIAEENLWPEGIYSFQVAKGEDAVSKSGNEMIVLKLNVYNDDGGYKIVDDYLLESMPFKLRHAAEAMGLLDYYENGELHGYLFEGKTGKVKLYVQKSKDPQYADKNAVKDYVVDEESAAQSAPKPSAAAAAMAMAMSDDEIPF